MSSEEPKGPSKAGVIVAALSVLLCVALVLDPVPAWFGIIAVILWLGWVAPTIMKAGGLVFFDPTDPTDVDLGTGFIGFLWWAGLYWVTASHYTFWEWLLGATLAILTAIIIGKMARHWTALVMFLLGLLLGWGILWLNVFALNLEAPMGNPVMGAYSDSAMAGFVLLTALVTLAITKSASCAYWETKLDAYESKQRRGLVG